MRRSTLNFGFRDGFPKKVTFELGPEGRIEVSQIQGRTLQAVSWVKGGSCKFQDSKQGSVAKSYGGYGATKDKEGTRKQILQNLAGHVKEFGILSQ